MSLNNPKQLSTSQNGKCLGQRTNIEVKCSGTEDTVARSKAIASGIISSMFNSFYIFMVYALIDTGQLTHIFAPQQ